ncbi:hypothetical protein AB6A40_011831, partial [Gnathostoma spinigerum]
ALLGKTIEKMRARRDAISLPLSEASTSTAFTPERAEFETFKNGVSLNFVTSSIFPVIVIVYLFELLNELQ